MDSPVDTLKAALAKLERDGDEHRVCGDIRAAIVGLSGPCTGSHCDDTLLWGEHDTDCALHTTPRAVGDGMVQVPREPTPVMVNAGVDADDLRTGFETVKRIYGAMLSAAPSEGSAPINYQSADSRLIVEGGAQGELPECGFCDCNETEPCRRAPTGQVPDDAIRRVVEFIFRYFRSPTTAGDLSDEVVADVRAVEKWLATPPASSQGDR